MAARALEFAILTAARTGEVLGMRWGEVDLDRALWTVPAGRMKAGREHRVPLAPAAAAVLRRLSSRDPLGRPVRPAVDALVFPGTRAGRPLSNMAMLMLIRRMGCGDLTAHGFRSTFRDWTAEATTFPRELAEAALAHVNGDKTEAAYARSDLLAKRASLMEAWAAHCGTQEAARGGGAQDQAARPA
jgi:integrase